MFSAVARQQVVVDAKRRAFDDAYNELQEAAVQLEASKRHQRECLAEREQKLSREEDKRNWQLKMLKKQKKGQARFMLEKAMALIGGGSGSGIGLLELAEHDDKMTEEEELDED